MGDSDVDVTSVRGDFAPALRRLRHSAGLTQEGLVAALDGEFARSTLANIEAGREVPSTRFFGAVSSHFPDWGTELSEPFNRARHRSGRADLTRNTHPQRTTLGPLGGRAVVEQLRTTYIFRDGPAPAEIIESRRIRATSHGVAGYVARFHTGSGEFDGDFEILWGGRVRGSERLVDASTTTLLNHIEFDAPLHRGEIHEHATRCLVRRDPNPASSATTVVDAPTTLAEIRLRFLAGTPSRIEAFGPVADRALLEGPGGSNALVDYRPLDAAEDLTASFPGPAIGVVYGVRWTW